MTILASISWPGAKGILEILVMAVVLYYIILFFHGTRGAQVLSGLAILLIALLTMTYVFSLDTLTWILQRFSVYLAVGFLIIFQPEIRRALAQIGRQHLFAPSTSRDVVEGIIRSVKDLADRKIGALIAIERDVGTRPIEETGTPIDSAVTSELLASIFYPHTPLHDGGVIIRGDRIAAAGCLFPLSQRDGLSKSLGTRHRAAIGLTEESDAIVLVVSEETGSISVAYRGRLRRGIDEDRLNRILTKVLLRDRRGTPKVSWLTRGVRIVQQSLGIKRRDAGTESHDHAA